MLRQLGSAAVLAVVFGPPLCAQAKPATPAASQAATAPAAVNDQSNSAPAAVGWFSKTRLGKWLVGPKPATKIQDASAPVTFNWTGVVPGGRSINIRSVNGPIRVEAGSGPGVEVTAVKVWQTGDPSSVRLVVTRVGAGQQDVLICALWSPRSTCTGAPGEPKDAASASDDVTVEFSVRVPPGVKFSAQAVRSDISITGLTSDVKASTVNGSIIGTFRGTLNAQVDLSTVTGSYANDFPVTASGPLDPGHLRATLGTGGPKITMATTSGNVELHRR
jgi:hypothetical protein